LYSLMLPFDGLH